MSMTCPHCLSESVYRSTYHLDRDSRGCHKSFMPATVPTADSLDAALLAYEAEFEALVLEWQQLDAAWPKGKTPMERWQIGRRHQAYLIRIRELHRDIAEAEAKTLAGAAVQLRRLRAVLDDESSVVEGLLEGALKVIEMSVSSQPLRAGG